MKRILQILILISMAGLLAGCATQSVNNDQNVVKWEDVQKTIDDPFQVDELILSKSKLWPVEKTHGIKWITKKRIAWKYTHIRWGHIAPGLDICTMQYHQNYKNPERRRWLSFIAINIELFSKYLASTNQSIPAKFSLSVEEVRKNMSRPDSDSVNKEGNGDIVWNIFGNPEHEDISSFVSMKFRGGKLIRLQYGGR